VTHGNDAFAAGDGAEFTYDLVVIGGGSGGLAASKEAAALGARVAVRHSLRAKCRARMLFDPLPTSSLDCAQVFDFVKPSWQGSSWGLGGTCVNVGCIPKKLMHNATLLGEALEDARAYGWGVPEKSKMPFDWLRLVAGVQDHIASLNFGYRVALKDAKVEYLNALGEFKDAHTIVTTDKKGKTKEITARRIIVAVGGRPQRLAIPGGDLAISSDDIFSLKTPPGRTLIVGASYIALECGGFLAGLGFDTTILVRSILLRGFDQSIAEKIGENMRSHGIRFVQPAEPKKIEKLESGRLSVTWADSATGVETSEVFDTVLVAVGRVADTAKLNLAAVGVVAGKSGKIPTRDEQTNVPHVYAIGDVVEGKPELTPVRFSSALWNPESHSLNPSPIFFNQVAIAAGRLLARRIYGGSFQGMDYERIATTVFTPLEYGCVGLSEEAALEAFGPTNIEVYHSSFTPLEWTVVESRAIQGQCVPSRAHRPRVILERPALTHFPGAPSSQVLRKTRHQQE
jgi:thioredoxin reductase (NADPH)